MLRFWLKLGSELLKSCLKIEKRRKPYDFRLILEVPPRFELGIEVLQTFALPLGYGTECPYIIPKQIRFVKSFSKVYLNILKKLVSMFIFGFFTFKNNVENGKGVKLFYNIVRRRVNFTVIFCADYRSCL